MLGAVACTFARASSGPARGLSLLVRSGFRGGLAVGIVAGCELWGGQLVNRTKDSGLVRLEEGSQTLGLRNSTLSAALMFLLSVFSLENPPFQGTERGIKDKVGSALEKFRF